MASSNRHWPSMFRSNPAAACDGFHHQPADMNNSSSSSSSFLAAGRPSLLSSGIEESGRSPEPKPRWNPRPEQIRILEGIFNSGVVNPPRDEIRRIRMQLQEYGQVGDANVFYWFQNRKSRTKNKLRAAAGQPHPGRAALARASTTRAAQAAAPASPVTPPRHLLASPLAPTSSSSSSSDRSSGSSKSVKLQASLTSAAAAASQGLLLSPSTGMNLFTATPSPSPLMSACQLYYHPPMPTTPTARELLAFPEPSLLPQWPAPQSQYLPATELGGVLGSNAHTNSTPTSMHPSAAVSPGGVLLSLCNDALGQQADITDTYMTAISKQQALGQYVLDAAAASSSSSISDAVSAVMREDEKARLGLLHYGCFGFTAATTAADDSVTTAATVDDFPTAAPLINAAAASSALTDQLQGLLDAGLIGAAAGHAQQPATATVVALPLQVAAARGATDAASVSVSAAGAAAQCYSVPAMTHLDVKLFGEAAVLLRHNGDHVLVDHSGVTVEPLLQGAVYYVLVAN